MKKIIGLALALAAAALVFVGCSDEAGGGETEGNKWELKMTIDGTANAEVAVQDGMKYRRFWKQLGTKNEVAGITTTITVNKEKYSTSKNNSGVVGLMFDYNDSEKNAYGEGDRKDFYLIGFNFKRRLDDKNTEASYYITRNEGVPYDKKESLDTSDDDLVTEDNGAKGALVTKGVTKLDTTEYLKKAGWETLDDKYFVDGTSEYKVVVSIRPSLGENGLPNEKGYDIYFGKSDGSFDKIFTCDLTTLTNSKRVENTTKVTVGKTDYNLPCGGIAVYGNAKTINYQYGTLAIHDTEGTKIVATFDNKTAGKKTETKKVENVDALSTGIIGNLQIASDYGDNITVIVE